MNVSLVFRKNPLYVTVRQIETEIVKKKTIHVLIWS